MSRSICTACGGAEEYCTCQSQKVPLLDAKGTVIGEAVLDDTGMVDSVKVWGSDTCKVLVAPLAEVGVGYSLDVAPREIAMKAWAVRHKGTRLYLPDRKGTRGWTNDEPTSPDRPRLHWSEASARAALRAWAKGVWVKRSEGGYRYGFDMEAEYDEWTEIRRVETRRAEDMEIVEFGLEER